MGPINWMAVGVAALVAAGLAPVWYGRLLRGEGPPPAALLALLLPAWLMGHNFARVGADVLAAKPWLYWMMSGGFAPAIVWPVLAISGHRSGRFWGHAGYWLLAFLAMGTVFRLMA
ncbi:MAG TPA: DUF1761 domain-containing protein [Novosphingobium sp.]|nr:DUF1761 domain-containing protein [Novosphingobium sp.]